MGKPKRVKPRLLKGMQDSWPELARARRKMLAVIAEVCERFGFLPFDTPSMEALETLLGLDPTEEQLVNIFHFTNNDDEEVGLRYELTGSLARVVSQYQMELARPFRRYQVGNAFRWDKPEPGRFREFLQFDVDTVGSSSMAADAEIVSVVDTVLRELGVEGYLIRVSNRKLLTALGEFCGAAPEQGRDIYRVIDKLDKFDRERIRLELGPGLVDQSGDPIRGLGLDSDQIAKIDAFLDLPNEGNNEETLDATRKLLSGNELAQEGLAEVEQVLDFAQAYGVESTAMKFDLHLARGLGYYTGPVFEVILESLPSFGSVFGGGRYDGLVERFLGPGQGIPATGASVGPDRLLAGLSELGKLAEAYSATQVLVTVMDKSRMSEYIAMVRELRDAGIAAEVFLGGGSLGKQLKYADRLGIPLAVIAGEDEFAEGTLSVKDLELGRRIGAEAESREEWQELKQQFTINRDELVASIRERLAQG
jgi:histidyl-tRNA synthetase